MLVRALDGVAISGHKVNIPASKLAELLEGFIVTVEIGDQQYRARLTGKCWDGNRLEGVIVDAENAWQGIDASDD